LQHLGLALSLAASGLGFRVFTLQKHLGLALSLYLAASSGLGFEQHLGLALSLYLAASGLGFEGAEKGTALWH
jgi:hypothetical protein